MTERWERLECFRPDGKPGSRVVEGHPEDHGVYRRVGPDGGFLIVHAMGKSSFPLGKGPDGGILLTDFYYAAKRWLEEASIHVGMGKRGSVSEWREEIVAAGDVVADWFAGSRTITLLNFLTDWVPAYRSGNHVDAASMKVVRESLERWLRLSGVDVWFDGVHDCRVVVCGTVSTWDDDVNLDGWLLNLFDDRDNGLQFFPRWGVKNIEIGAAAIYRILEVEFRESFLEWVGDLCGSQVAEGCVFEAAITS